MTYISDIAHIVDWILIFSYWLIVAAVTVRVLMKRRTVAVSMAWLLVIYIVPLVGIIAYLLFGELYLGSRRAARSQAMWKPFSDWFNSLSQCDHLVNMKSSHTAAPLFNLCRRRLKTPCINGNQLHLFTTTDDILSAIVRDINLAQHHISMVFYIWNNGGLVEHVVNALIEAAKRGVKCRVMLDSVGSLRFFRSRYPELFRHAQIDLVEALHVNPLRVFLRRMDLRQHRKIVIIDNDIAYTGSMNMVDPRYFKQDAGVGQWVDMMVRIEGPAASALNCIFAWDWEVETGERHLPSLPSCPILPVTQENAHAVQVLASGPGFPKDLLPQALSTAIFAARKRIVMTTPYFIPDDSLMLALCSTASRGVQVDIVIPKHNDSLMVGWASRAFFDELLAAGVRIHQFEDGLLHAKSLLIDDHLSLVGTVNLDIRSMWLNFEVTIAIDDTSFGEKLGFVQDDYIARSTQLNIGQWLQRPLRHRIAEKFFYFFTPLL
ncbi:cardiolipin synthase [Plesiomonas shigelloides]|nr:cardiolipin synthase [Plesiomonas shigelloides]QWK98057.1 cardiolipin synthase [Plesiomonas shigelloides]